MDGSVGLSFHLQQPLAHSSVGHVGYIWTGFLMRNDEVQITVPIPKK